jgi:O-antigen/teichoic acid export membrane protein
MSAAASHPTSDATAPRGRSYGSGARILSIGIAATGLLTFAYFSISSHVLGAAAAEHIDVLWSVMFVVISVIYRPVEQLLSRTIAERRAHGHVEHPLRVPIALQAGFALAFLVVALALRMDLLDNVFDHYTALYDVLVIGTLAYAGSYFARGWLAGNEYFALYGGLVLMESTSRICFALAVALGIASGQTAVALGIAAAPLLSLVVVPAAFARRGHERGGAPGPTPITVDEAEAALAGPGTEAAQEAAAHPSGHAPSGGRGPSRGHTPSGDRGPSRGHTPGGDRAPSGGRGGLSLRRGGRFALWVSGIMLSEQTLLNAAVLTVYATSDQALAGIVFNVMLIARAPLQLFQAIQTSLLPHLTGLEAKEGHAAFARAIRLTVLAIATFAAAVALGLLIVGPFVMRHVLFGQHYTYGRFGLALIGIGMGLHLASGALNQAALARDRAREAAACWLIAAVVFLAWMLTPAVGDQVLRAELGYCGATGLLALLLALLYRRGTPTQSPLQA